MLTTTLPRARPSPDPGQRLGHLVERERAVDVDAEVTRDAQIGHRLEVRRPLLDREHTQPAVA